MGVEQIREVLHLRIEQADESFLRILHAMTEAYASEYLEDSQIVDEVIMAIPPSSNWHKLSREDLKAELAEANSEYERGEYTTLEELENDSETR